MCSVWGASQVTLAVTNPSVNAGDIRDLFLSLGGEDSLAEDMETHSSDLAWRISWTEEPGGIRSIQLHRVEHD